MAAPTDYFVDPSIAAASGAGTIGDPYGDLQHALDTVTRDATQGDQFNIKAGTDEILAGGLDLTTYGTPAASAPCIFRGYTTAADDLGIGGINCNSNSLFTSTAYTNIQLIDLDIHTFGSAEPIHLGAACLLLRCKIHGSTHTSDAVDVSTGSTIFGCYIYDMGTGAGDTVEVAGDCFIGSNFIAHSKTGDGIKVNAVGTVEGNVVVVSSVGGNGIDIRSLYTKIIGNTVYSSANGTGAGIAMTGASNSRSGFIANNIIEGFSGSGGKALAGTTSSLTYQTLIGNRYYDCESGFVTTGGWSVNEDNSVLASSPFTDPATDDFTVDDTVKAGAIPSYIGGPQKTSTPTYIDFGAAQRQESGGGSSTPGLAIG